MALDTYLANCGQSLKNLPSIAGSYEGRSLVICADAEGVWEELEAFGCRSDVGRGSVWKEGWDIMAVNRMVEVFPGYIEHAYSNEPKTLETFVKARRHEYRKEFGPPKHLHSITEGVDWRWPFGGHGTSGLGACLVGLGLGYDYIVLCGMPLDNGPHNGEPHWRCCRFESSEAASPKGRTGPNVHWKKARDLAFDDRVKSMSGRTKWWLGAPSL